MAEPPGGLSRRQAVLKRAFDLVVALPLALISAPLILLGWIAASLETRANGFYRQERIGRNAKTFKVVKLRTMKVGDPGSTVTRLGDERITRSGKVLRMTKVDELPQLYNVLVGEMSMVGPRPDVAGYADGLTGPDRVLLSVRPGITGPASLTYRDEERILAGVDDPEQHNRDVIWPDKVRINRRYLESWTLRGDVRYLFATFFSTGYPQQESS